jgi:hypothetical protein
VAVVALIVAIGGTSYAAFTLPKGSVGTAQLKNRAVTNAKLDKNSVGTGKIRGGAVTASRLAATTQVVSADVTIPANGTTTASVACPAGTRVLGGGGGSRSTSVFNLRSTQNGNGWQWIARNTDPVNAQIIFATAVCLAQ